MTKLMQVDADLVARIERGRRDGVITDSEAYHTLFTALEPAQPQRQFNDVPEDADGPQCRHGAGRNLPHALGPYCTS